ncbi:MAG: histidine kinase [Acidobacteriota bacterium]|nr:histidine kinase [Acidobacteriota bacterium]
MKRALFCCALVIAARASFALDPSLAISQYGHTAWRVRDGHFPGTVTSIAQTRDGYLWVGTDGGLLRYDGVRFELWVPPGAVESPSRVVALLGASDGSLWIGTSSGLAQWTSGLAQWNRGRYVMHETAGRFGALLEDRRGTVWAGRTRGRGLPPLCRVEQGRLRCFAAPGEPSLGFISALHEDREGELWMGGAGGVCRWRGGNPECFPIPELLTRMNKTGVFRIGHDAEGVLWVDSANFGAQRLLAGEWSKGETAPVFELKLDRAGSFWIGTQEQGLIRRIGARVERFTEADGLSGDSVTNVLEDREGNVWVATTAGLDRFRDVKVATVTTREGLPFRHVGAVTRSSMGGVWVANHRALVRMTDARSLPAAVVRPPGAELAGLFEDSRGRLWVGVDEGLASFADGRFSLITLPDGSRTGVVLSMAEDRDGDLWLTTTHATFLLLRIRDGRVIETVSRDAIGVPSVMLAAHPEGGVWLGVRDGQLLLYRAGRVVSRLPSPGNGMLLRDLLVDGRGTWAVTNRGLLLYRENQVHALGVRNGLTCQDLDAAVEAGDGAIWLKGPCGLMRIGSRELDAWAMDPRRRVAVRLLDAFDGVQAGATPFAPRAAKSNDGLLWFANDAGGLQVLDPSRLDRRSDPPPVQITRVIADRKSHDLQREMRLPALTHDLEIHYTALSLSIPEKVRFRYRLEGADADWREVGTRREAYYGDLGHGTYVFRVLASNHEGVWNETGASMVIVIPPAFHQTRTFLLICIVSVVTLVLLLLRWRIHIMHRRMQQVFRERLDERTKIARELHDRLLQGLVSTSLQLHVALEELPTKVEGRGRLERVQELMGGVVDEGRRVLDGLRSEDAEHDLASALSHVGAEIGLPQPRVPIAVSGTVRPLQLEIRDEIYQVAREALVNAFQHSQAGRIDVRITYGSRDLRVVVRDDGIGIDDEVLRSGREGHWGLAGMRERAAEIGAKLMIRTTRAKGTEVAIVAPAAIAYEDHRGPVWTRFLSRRAPRETRPAPRETASSSRLTDG